MKGTPTSLEEAILNSLEDPVFSDYRLGKEKEIEVVYGNIRDYLAQKFTIAIAKNRDHQAMLMDLFNACVRRRA